MIFYYLKISKVTYKQKLLVVTAAVIVVLLGFVFFSKSGQTSYKVIALLSSLNPTTTQLKSPPNLKPTMILYQDRDKFTQAEIFRKGYKTQGAVIISGGVGLTDYNWALINGFAANLANIGITVMIPKPDMVKDDIVTEDGIKSYVNAYKYLETQDNIDKSKIGFFGFCAGGSFVLLAAEDPEINSRVSVVSAFSPYNNLIDYYAEAFSREAITSSGSRPWKPAKETVSALTENFNYRLQNSQRTENIQGILQVNNRQGGVTKTKEIILKSLPGSFLEEARLLSPDKAATNIKSDVYIIHDYNDTFTPREESQRLAAEIGPNANLLMPTIFDHTILQKNISPVRWITEGLKVITVFYKIIYKLS